MTSAFVLLQDVDLALELGVRGHGTRNADDLAALDLFTLGAAQQQTTVLAGVGLVHGLVEHLDTGDGGLLRRTNTHDFDFGVQRQLAALHTTGYHGAAAGNGEDVFDRHQERLVEVTNGLRNVGVNRFYELFNLLGPLGIAFQGLQSGKVDNRAVAVEALLLQVFADFVLHDFQHVFVHIRGIALVQSDQDGGHADLLGQQDVLLGLSHRAVSGSHHEDSAVHLRSAGNHVLDVVGVARGVHVSVVTVGGFVFNVRNVDGDAALTFLRSVIHLIEGGELVCGQIRILVSQHLGDSCSQSSLAVVNVTNGADVNVRLVMSISALCHFFLSSWTLGSFAP